MIKLNKHDIDLFSILEIYVSHLVLETLATFAISSSKFTLKLTEMLLNDQAIKAWFTSTRELRFMWSENGCKIPHMLLKYNSSLGFRVFFSTESKI